MGRGRSRRCRGNVGVERRTYLRKEPAPRDPGGFSAAQRAPAGELEDLTTAFGGTADLYGAAEAAPSGKSHPIVVSDCMSVERGPSTPAAKSAASARDDTPVICGFLANGKKKQVPRGLKPARDDKK